MAEQKSNKEPISTLDKNITNVIVFMIYFVPLYYFFVWKNLPLDADGGNKLRFGMTAGILVVIALIYIFVKRKKIKLFESLSNFIVIIVIIFGAALFSIYFIDQDKIILLKLFVILYFSFLPAWLYLHFISVKGRTLWEEYVLNLYRLGVDTVKHLPEPPLRSDFHKKWAREHKDIANVAESGGHKSLYEKKFEGLYGTIQPDNTTTFSSFRAENLWPVAIATVLIAIGWILVTGPESVFNKTVFPTTDLSGQPVLPLESLRFAFLGAYFYILQMLVRRYFQNDLKTSAYISSTVRIIVVVLLVLVIDLVWNDAGYTVQLSALAFIIGVFPHIGWQALQSLAKLPMKLVIPSLKQKFPLSKLDGLNIWYESRLLEEGIEDMQNLATANLVDVMLNTRIPVERLIDWVDQSILYLHMSDGNSAQGEKNIELLRMYGIRTATDLIDVCSSVNNDLRMKLERLLNTDDNEPSIVLSILATFDNEPNLIKVQNWKSNNGKSLHGNKNK